MDAQWMDLSLFGGCLLLITGMVVAYLLGQQSGALKERKRQQRERWLHQKSNLYKLKKELRQSQACVEQLTKELDDHVEQSREYVNRQAELLRYRQEVERLEGELHKRLDEPVSSQTASSDCIDLINAMHEDPLHVNPSREDWQRLFDGVACLYPSFMRQLRERKVTQHEMEICCLIRLRFDRAEMLAIFHCTSEALTKSRSRLKKRLELADARDLEQFLLQL